MKLVHPKSWYEKSADLEGNSEVGAGIPPGSRVQPTWERQLVSSDVTMSFLIHNPRRKTATPKPHIVRSAAKAACHK